MKPLLSVIVPCYNEAPRLAGTLNDIAQASSQLRGPYEVIIVDDGSLDQTFLEACRLAAQVPNRRVVHHCTNLGFGAAYKSGLQAAKGDYVMMIPGDGEVGRGSIEGIMSRLGTADLIIPYIANPIVRPLKRRLLSRLYVLLVNSLTGLHVRYYNGPCAIWRELVESVGVNTTDFSYMTVILVRLLKQGYTHVNVPMVLNPQHYHHSSALRWRNIRSVGKTLIRLAWEVRGPHWARSRQTAGRVRSKIILPHAEDSTAQKLPFK